MSEGWPSIVLNTPAYDTSAILWRKRATQQLEISTYHYMTPVCLQVHARHIETATHHCSRSKTMLPIKTYKIQEKWIFFYLLDTTCWRYIAVYNSHSDLIECFIIDLAIVRFSNYLRFSILYIVSFWDESKGFCMAWWFCMTTRGKQIHKMC